MYCLSLQGSSSLQWRGIRDQQHLHVLTAANLCLQEGYVSNITAKRQTLICSTAVTSIPCISSAKCSKDQDYASVTQPSLALDTFFMYLYNVPLLALRGGATQAARREAHSASLSSTSITRTYGWGQWRGGCGAVSGKGSKGGTVRGAVKAHRRVW